MYFYKVILENTWLYLFNKNSFSYYFNILTFYNDRLFNLDPKNKFELIWGCILKVMSFTIFRNFLEFLWIYLSIFFIFKLIKTIKNEAKKGLFISRDPRVCDVARKAMWQSHAAPRECLRGAKVIRVRIYIYS